jgi:ABC-type antimicrobial peptide transport system permease subunit
MALGAMRGTVLRMVLKEALQLLGWGLLLGGLALFLTMRFTVAMLHGVSAYDPSTLVGVAGTLVIVTILAALVPALRAATADPIEALRAE